MSRNGVELWQAEWCPWSHRVRQRLTELDVSYLAHQVPVERSNRSELISLSGQAQIPVLKLDRHVITGTAAILAFLDETFAEPDGAAEHRAKAREKAAEFAPHAAELATHA